jgi:subtilisin family serine protease
MAMITSPAQAAPDGNRYIVVLQGSVAHPANLARTQTKQVNGRLGFVYRHALTGYSAILPKSTVDELRNNPQVVSVTADRRVELAEEELELETEDNGEVELLEAALPTGISRTFAPENNALAINGEDDVRANVDVAVIDTGIDFEHPDLNVVARTNCVPPGEESGVEECVDNSGVDGKSHGTHVAGTIGAIDNGFGVVGVAAGARMWAVKVLNNGGIGYISWIIAGVDWVTAHSSEIEVANMSLGCICSAPALDEAIEGSADAGIVYAVAAGNSASDAKYTTPANNPDVITVSALADYNGQPGGGASPTCAYYGSDDRLASFSNYGEAVEVAAPGVCILSTEPGGSYGMKSGTSMASPHVAGAAAVLAGRNNPEDLEDVESIRLTIDGAGNFEWTDTSGDGVQEPLLDVSNEETYILGSPPDVAVEEATYIEAGEATLRGEVNPNGISTTYHFEWGDQKEFENGDYEHRVPEKEEEDLSAGEGMSYQQVEETIEGLVGGETYHFRLAARNTEGAESVSESASFETPAWLPAGWVEVTNVGIEEATVLSHIYTAGFETTYRLEWGEDEEYGNSVEETVSGGKEAKEVSEMLELDQDTTYYYHLAVENINGEYPITHVGRLFPNAGKFRTHSSAGFHAEAYPVRMESYEEGEFLHVEVASGSVVCEPPVVSGEFEASTPVLDAQGFEGEKCNSGAFEMRGCELSFFPGNMSEGESEGILEVGPPGCGPIKIAYKLMSWYCPIEIPSQVSFPVTFRNEGEQAVAIEMSEIDSMGYQFGGECSPFGEFEGLSLEGNWTIHGVDPESEEEVGVWVAEL